MLSTVFSPFLSPPSSPQPALEELLVEFFVPQHLNYSGKNFLDAKKKFKKLQICFHFVSQDYKSKLPFPVQSGNTPFISNCILAGLAGRDLLFGRWLAPLSFVPGTPTRNCLSSGTGPPNNFSSWTAARSLSRDVGFETPRWSVTRRNTHYVVFAFHESEANAGSLLSCKWQSPFREPFIMQMTVSF